MTPKKIIVILLAGLAAIFVSVILYITLIIDLNNYKPQIIEQVEINTGRQLVIDGDISWWFIPNIGFTLGETRIKNPEGFPSQSLMAFESAQADLAFWPLLSKRIEVGLISIHGLTLSVHTRADGVSNLDTPQKTVAEDALKNESAEESPENSAPVTIEDLVIDGIEVVDAKITIENLTQNSKQSIKDINFTLETFSLDKEVPISFTASVDTGEVQADIQSDGHIKIAKSLQKFDFIKLKTKVMVRGDGLPNQQLEVQHQISGYFDAANQYVNLSSMDLSILGIDIKGNLEAKLASIPNIEFKVAVSDVDLDKIFAGTKNETEVKSGESKSEGEKIEEQEIAIDLSWMKDFNVKGLMTVDSIKVNNLTMSGVHLPLQLQDGQMQLSKVKAQFYQGKLVSDVTLDGRKSEPRYGMKANLTGVQALPLVKDLLEKELISGAVNMSMAINGRGLDDKSLRSKSKGNGKFAFTDGAIHGINVAELIRNSYAKIKGQTIQPSNEADKTDFASFTGSFKLADGVVTNPDLKLLSPLLRISGNGTANIVDETVNYELQTAIVGTLKGQGGEPLTDLKKLMIPLKIKGSMENPKVSLDMKKLLENELKDEVKNKLKSWLSR
ncbi:MAG: hypothetical protein DRQ47_03690 [Gammaproteobacteria bacterium]|nr:MAG: hypothetical protein DRQ47_03690 [Gammaproteobacteria bacterium]